MFDALQAGITWAQSLPAAPKGVISMVFVLLCGLAIFVLWQRPPEPVPEKQPSGTTNQAGNAASTGQSGGVTAGLYINQAPPVTEQQKAEALSGLQSELEELANFPKRADIPEPRTLLEYVSTINFPHQLFVVVNRYYKNTILSMPKVGGDLWEFKINYYTYEGDEFAFENDTTMAIGKLVNVEFSQAWTIYFRYFLLRAAGLSQQQIIEGGKFLNYGITWADCERIYGELISKPSIVEAVRTNLALRDEVLRAANAIINKLKNP